MADFWLFFVKNINYSGQKLIKSLSVLFKNIINSSNAFSKNGISQIEIQKMKWELKYYQEKLGAHVYKNNISNGAYDFSNDVYFNELVEKIKEIQKFLNKKNKN